MDEVTFNLDIDAEELDRKMKEIEELQAEVDKILRKPLIIRWFYMRKAERLHDTAQRKMISLFYPTLIRTVKKNREK